MKLELSETVLNYFALNAEIVGIFQENRAYKGDSEKRKILRRQLNRALDDVSRLSEAETLVNLNIDIAKMKQRIAEKEENRRLSYNQKRQRSIDNLIKISFEKERKTMRFPANIVKLYAVPIALKLAPPEPLKPTK